MKTVVVETGSVVEPEEIGEEVTGLLYGKGIEGAQSIICKYVGERADARDTIVAILEGYAAKKREKSAAKVALEIAESIRALTMLELLKGVEQ